MLLRSSQFSGCVVGLATGDALGAPHEGGPLERLMWRMIGRTSDGCLRWTDDTQMALDLAESLLSDGGVTPDRLAVRFAESYRWSRGYGPGAAKILKRIRRGEHWSTATTAVYRTGSFGSGAAMRSPVLALFYTGARAELIEAARSSAQVTHRHPLGIEGSVLIAVATRAMLARCTLTEVVEAASEVCSSHEFMGRLKQVTTWLAEGSPLPKPREVAAQLGNGITAATSCPTALYIALRFRDSPFEEMIQFIISCRGDVDTIGAMAGALWGAANGAEGLPPVKLEARARLNAIAERLYERYSAGMA